MASETPKQRRDRWFRTARGEVPYYNKPPGPPQPELTKDQATKIYNVSGTPAALNPYKDKIIQYMMEYSQTLQPEQRVAFNELVEQASSVCGKELQRAAEMNPSLSEEQKFIKLYGIALALVAGYKDTYNSHFEVNSKNEIIGLRHPHQQRQLECDAYLKQKQAEKWRPSAVEVGYGGRKKRKTRKISKKSKKTLRRK